MVLLAGTSLLTLPSCGSEPGPGRPNVLIVTFDTTRTDALGCYGGPPGVSPTVDDFAASGLRFKHAFTPAPLTLPAHSSLFTGRTPDEHGVRSNNAYALPREEITLAEILSEEGYDTAAFVGSYVLDSQYGLAQGFGSYGDEIDVAGTEITRVAERSADRVTNDALAWLDEREDGAPFFLWVHYYDPHYPHELQPGQSARFDKIYHDEIAFCDAQLGRLRDDLRGRKLLTNTLVILTADHGEGQLEHGESTHGYFLYQGTQHVPLIFSHPDLEQGGLREESVSLIDVLPTVLEFIGLESPRLTGRSLLHPSPDAQAPIYMEAELARIDFGLAPLRGAVSGQYKLIEAPHLELYDLEQDPQERRNLASSEVARVQTLREWLRDREVNSKGSAVFVPDQASTRKLLGLGYAGSGEDAEVSREDWRPEQLTKWADLLNAGLRHYQTGSLPEAISSLEKLVASCDTSYSAQLYLGMALVQTDSLERGLDHLERAVQLQPLSSAEAYWNIAVTRARLGLDRQIRPALIRAVQIDPTHLRARQKLAEALLAGPQPGAARTHLRALVEYGSDTPEGRWAKKSLANLQESN